MATAWHRRLFTQTVAFQLATIALVLLVAGLAFAWRTQSNLTTQFGHRALAVAESVAALPVVIELVDDPTSPVVLQPIAESIRKATGVDFVVIADRGGIRRTHPVSERIGFRVSTDPTPALQGASDIYVQQGTLGQSVRGKAPIESEDGEVIGLVSVGILTGTVSQAFDRELTLVLLTSSGALMVGALGAWHFARRLRRQTLDLQPEEIATLYEHREAMLQGIREGVIGVDRKGRVNLVNAAAERLLDMSSADIGRPFTEVTRSPVLEGLIAEPPSEPDINVAIGDRVLVVNVMPIAVRRQQVGRVITLRDRTELEALLGELETVHGLVDALRVQAHEYSNSLHTISGLIELGKADEAVQYITDLSASHQRLTGAVEQGLGDNLLVALLLAKSSLATERGIDFFVDAVALADVDLAHTRDLVTIVGNLIDNALDSVSSRRFSGGRVDVGLEAQDSTLIVSVADNGDGISSEMMGEIFNEGFTTKSRRLHSGIGLSLVTEAVRRLNGSLDVRNEDGAVFTVELPDIIRPRRILESA